MHPTSLYPSHEVPLNPALEATGGREEEFASLGPPYPDMPSAICMRLLLATAGGSRISVNPPTPNWEGAQILCPNPKSIQVTVLNLSSAEGTEYEPFPRASFLSGFLSDSLPPHSRPSETCLDLGLESHRDSALCFEFQIKSRVSTCFSLRF